jgi:hypothetical protein
LLFLFSCTPKKSDINQYFINKYGSKVDIIKNKRIEPENLKNIVYYSKLPTRAEILDMQNKIYDSQNYVNVSKYYEVDNSMIGNKAIDPKIFNISYSQKNYGPFKNLSRNNQDINSYDAFGISSKFDNKSYTIIKSSVLSKNIEDINNKKKKEDIENSMILIKERSDFRRKEKISNILDDA